MAGVCREHWNPNDKYEYSYTLKDRFFCVWKGWIEMYQEPVRVVSDNFA